MSTEPILVVGAGLTGLAIAKTLELSKAQDRIRLFDGTMPDKHPGYSLTLLQSTIDTLESAWNCKGAFSNCGVDASLGNEGQIGQRYVNAQTGQAVDGPGQSGDSRRISRDALDKLLKKDVKVEFDKRVANVEKIATGFKLTMKDDSTVEGFLLLACDGVHSSIRKQLHPDVKPSILPFVVYTGQRKMTPEEAKPFLASTSTVQTGLASSGCITFAFNTISSEGGRLQWIYSRNPKEDDPLFTPDRSNPSASDIPNELYEELHALAEECTEPFRSLLKSIEPEKDRQYNWLMREVVSGDVLKAQGSVEEGKVVYCGDAAHAMPIYGGLGGNQALLDGLAIGKLIASTDDRTELLSRLAQFQSDSQVRWKDAASSSRKYLEDLHAKL